MDENILLIIQFGKTLFVIKYKAKTNKSVKMLKLSVKLCIYIQCYWMNCQY